MERKSIDELVVDARQLLGEDRYPEAIAILTSIPPEQRSVLSLHWLSNAYLYNEQYDLCLSTSRQVLHMDDRHLLAMANETESLMELGAKEAALENARRALAVLRSTKDVPELEYERTFARLWRALDALNYHEEALSVARVRFAHDQNIGGWELRRSLTATERVTELKFLHGDEITSYLQGLSDAVFHMVFLGRYQRAAELSLEGLAFISIPRLPISKNQGSGFLVYYIESLILCGRYEDALRLCNYWTAYSQTPIGLKRTLLALQIAALYSAGRKVAATSLLASHLKGVKRPLPAFRRLRWKLTWDQCKEVLNQAFMEVYPETDPKSIDLTVRLV